MIVAIAPEQDIPNEIEILNQLFLDGLLHYHLKKPDKDYKAHCEYLNKIDQQFHNRIVTYYHHELINSYNLKGIHFQEQERIDNIDNPGRYFKNLNLFGKTISASFQEIKDLEACYFEFDYHLLSSVINSKSLKNTNDSAYNVTTIDKIIITMYSVSDTNLSKFDALGYNGICISSDLWESDTPNTFFKKIKQHYN